MSISKKLNYSIFRYDSDVIPTNPTLLFFTTLRDRPFNLKGGGYGFLLRSEFFFRTTRELEYFFFFLHQNRNIFLKKQTMET